jgi:hypothetical protein
MNMASFTDVDSASRFPVISAEAIAPASPGTTARMRRSMASRIPSIVLKNLSRKPGADGAVSTLIAPVTKPVAPMRWK